MMGQQQSAEHHAGQPAAGSVRKTRINSDNARNQGESERREDTAGLWTEDLNFSSAVSHMTEEWMGRYGCFFDSRRGGGLGQSLQAG